MSMILPVRAIVTLVAVPLLLAASSRVARADVYAADVDETLTDINDEGCLGNCIGDPVNALGPPDFDPGQGGTTVTLGPGGTLGLIFDQPCFVDNNKDTPDILVYEQGGVQIEDFFVEAAIVGEPFTGTQVRSTAYVNEPERSLDLTIAIGDGESGGSVDRIQIIDIAANGDEVEQGGGGFEVGWGADIDAVECLSQTTGTGGTGGGSTGGTGGGSGGDGDMGGDGGCECSLQSGNMVADGLVWLALAGLWLGYRRTRR